ncbi:MAG TPA: hypothetical protein VGB85_09050 [Nannocystis sp.]|jgi:hypothetical protein
MRHDRLHLGQLVVQREAEPRLRVHLANVEHGLADALDWQVEATIDFAALAGQQIYGLGDPRLDALLDELE